MAEAYAGPMSEQMALMDVDEGDYLVLEHGSFDFQTEGPAVEGEIEADMKQFDYQASGYELNLKQGRVFYFYYYITTPAVFSSTRDRCK